MVETLLFIYVVGACVSCIGFLLATIRHKSSRGYWASVAVAFYGWPFVVAGEVGYQVGRRMRARALANNRKGASWR